MPQVWFTSDTHLGHDFVARTRGFESHEEHDAELARRWDGRVAPRDEVWVLGDVAMNGWRDRLSWFGSRPGVKHLVLGNHDRAHPSQRNAHAHLSAYSTVFASVQSAASVKVDQGYPWGKEVLLSHFPYDGEGSARPSDPDRFTQWRLRDEGVTLLHGHVHDVVKVRESSLGTVMVHVGVDAWSLRPVNKGEVRQALDDWRREQMLALHRKVSGARRG